MLSDHTDAYHIAYIFGHCPIADSMYEVHRIPEEPAWIHVVNIANRPQSINIAIKVDTTFIELYHILESDS